MDTFHHYFFVGKLCEGLLHSFHTTLHVCFDDQVQFLQVAFLNLVEQVIQRHSLFGFSQHFFLMLCKIGFRIALCCLIILVYDEDFTGTWYIRKTQDFYRCRRSSFFYTLSLVIDHSSSFTVSRTCRDKVTNTESTLLNKHGCNRSPAFIQFSLDHYTTGISVRVSLQFQNFCCQQNGLQQFFNTCSCLCRYRNKFCGSAPVCSDQFMLC